jgi:hypothetical protein
VISPVPSRAAREKSAMKPGVLQILIELWEDNPTGFERFVGHLSRDRRPCYGSVTLSFMGGNISTIERKETDRP